MRQESWFVDITPHERKEGASMLSGCARGTNARCASSSPARRTSSAMPANTRSFVPGLRTLNSLYDPTTPFKLFLLGLLLRSLLPVGPVQGTAFELQKVSKSKSVSSC